jgi:hypothetical protein
VLSSASTALKLQEMLLMTNHVCAAHLYAPLVLPPLPEEARGLKMPTMATRSPGLQESTRSDSSTISTAAAAAQAAVKHNHQLPRRVEDDIQQRIEMFAAELAAAAKKAVDRCC